MTLNWNPKALDEIAASGAVDDALLELGDAVAGDARTWAPKDSGRGAASIHAELVEAGEVRVSWDEEHYYMRFPEQGTEHQRASPFLRPAALKYK